MSRLLLISSLVCLAAACQSAAKVEAPASENDTLKTAVRAYAVEFLRRNPTVNTYLGGAGLDPSLQDVDGTLRDYSPAALGQEDQWLMKARATIDGIPVITSTKKVRALRSRPVPYSFR